MSVAFHDADDSLPRRRRAVSYHLTDHSLEQIRSPGIAWVTWSATPARRTGPPTASLARPTRRTWAGLRGRSIALLSAQGR